MAIKSRVALGCRVIIVLKTANYFKLRRGGHINETERLKLSMLDSPDLLQFVQ